MHRLLFVSVMLLSLIATARAEDIRYPDDAGHIDITQAPYNAKGDGLTDCTAAIQQALIDRAGAGTIYFPNGTYLVSDTLEWKGRATRNMFQGQSRDGTIIKLRDRCPGFNDPSSPRPVIVTGYFPPQRFRNAIRNLTIDTGTGNAGAIGLRFNASNQGHMHTVRIRSGDGAGAIGLDMGYTGDVGPLLVKHLIVEGFDIGIYTAHGSAAQTLEYVSLAGQRAYGWVNDGQAVSARKLTSRNDVPVLYNKRGSGSIALIDSDFITVGGCDRAAIINESGLLARNISTQGYAQAIDGSNGTEASVKDARVDEFTSHLPITLFESPGRTLNLPIEETPEVPWDDPKDWVSVAKFKPKEVQLDRAGKVVERGTKAYDWTEAVQQAIDSGATTVYFPRDNGTGQPYRLFGTVHVRGKVRRITGMEIGFANNSRPVFQIDDGEAETVLIERFDWIYTDAIVRTNTRRNVVIFSTIVYLDVQPGGRVFVDDAVAHFRVKQGQLWLRQWNTEYTSEERHALLFPDYKPEFATHPGNLNDGGTVWCLGIKTEGDGTLLTTLNGGKSEVLGALVYANKNNYPQKRAFVVKDSSLSVSVGEQVIRQQPFNMVEESRGDQTRTLKPGVSPGRNGGGLYVLVSAYPGAQVAPKLLRAGDGETTIRRPPPATQPAPAMTVKIVPVRDRVRESDGQVEFRVERSGDDLSKPLSVRFPARQDFSQPMKMLFNTRGGAVEGVHIEPLPDHLTIPAGESSAILTVKLIDNSRPEPDRRLQLLPASSPDYTFAAPATPTAPPPAVMITDDDLPPAGTGTGLTATYFAGKDFTNPLVTRVDPKIDFGWDKKEPVKGIDLAKGFSIRWEGALEPQFSGTYRLSFNVSSYAALRVWVGEQQVIDFKNVGTEPKGRFGEPGKGLDSVLIPMEANKRYLVRIEYVGLNKYGQLLRMRWSSDDQFEQIIPTTQLHPKPQLRG